MVLEIEARNGHSPHTLLSLGNRKGRIQTAPFWSSQKELIEGLKVGDAVEVSGCISAYNERRQLQVEDLRVLPRSQVSPHDFVPSMGDTTIWWRVLDRWRGEIALPRLKATVDLLYEDTEFRRRFEECPASLNGHHAALGGLLVHTCEVLAMARPIACIAGAETDLVVAGVLLHDIGKLESYRWDCGFQMTEAGSLLGHVVLGALLLNRKLDRAEPCPCTAQERNLLHHLILSHHGKLEFGAPVTPMTLEAEVIHYADNASAKTRAMAEALALEENFAGDATVSTRGIWQLERRRVYRGGSDWGGEESAAPEK